jgi:hypothetical protein
MTTKNTKSNKPGPITVEVTATDIKLGVIGNFSGCAIARALKRLRLKNVEVEAQAVTFDKGTGKNRRRFYYDLPKRVTKFIERFDEGSTRLKPFTFTLRKPEVLAI